MGDLSLVSKRVVLAARLRSASGALSRLADAVEHTHALPEDALCAIAAMDVTDTAQGLLDAAEEVGR